VIRKKWKNSIKVEKSGQKGIKSGAELAEEHPKIAHKSYCSIKLKCHDVFLYSYRVTQQIWNTL